VTAGSAQTVSLSASGLPSGVTATFSPTSVTAGDSATLTVSTSASTVGGTYTIAITGAGTSGAHGARVALVVNPTNTGGIVEGNFETGDLSGWSPSGTASVVTTAHGGTWAAMLGASGPTVGDSAITQTFTVPSGGGVLSFFYQVHCSDTVSYDWATATL